MKKNSTRTERGEAWLLLRRHGGLWAVCRDAFREVTRRGAGRGLSGKRSPRVALAGGGELVADEILTLTARLRERPFPRCAASYAGAKVRGLAVWREEPVVLLEPGAPPPACLDPENPEKKSHGDEA